MALEDYFPCNYCGQRVFYDVEIYTNNNDYADTVAENRIVVLCENCTKTHEILIKRKKGKHGTRTKTNYYK